MKSTVEQINPVQCRVSVEITPEEVNSAFDNAYRKLQKKARIQGFRPGKAPLNVIKKIYQGHVSSEVAENLINTHLFSALSEQTIRPIASPMVEAKDTPTQGQEFAFSAVIDVMPKIDFDDYKGLKIEAEAFSVKDETVERELEALRRQHAKSRSVADGTAAAPLLLATISHTAKVDGADLPEMNVEGMQVWLGKGEIFEGLEGHIIGMQIGESKTAQVQLPETYQDQSLAGKEVEFNLVLTDLKHLDLPVLDDEFAKDLDIESAEQLKTRVRSQLESRAATLSRERLERALLDRVLEMHPFEVPPALVDQVIDSMISEMQHEAGEQRRQALTDQQLRQHFLPTARRRTQNTLILWHVTQKERLEITDEEVGARIDETLAGMGLADPKYLSRVKQSLEPRVRENLLFEKAMNFLIEHASVTPKTIEI